MSAALAQSAKGGDPRRAQALREFDMLRQALVGPAAMAVLDAPWAPLYVFVCFIIHPWIGLLTLLGGVALVALAIWNENALRESLKEASALAPKIYAAQEADGASAETIRALGMRRVLIERQLSARAELNDVQTSSLFRSSGVYLAHPLHPHGAAIGGAGAWRLSGDRAADFAGRPDRRFDPGRARAGAAGADRRRLAPDWARPQRLQVGQ